MAKKTVLITGGSGFIGRWLVDFCLRRGEHVVALDNYHNSKPENIREFKDHPNFTFVRGTIEDRKLLSRLFKKHKFSLVYHLAASIIVQDSIDDPRTTFNNDVVGTFEVLEQCREHKTRMVFMSTCMVYARAKSVSGIAEDHPTLPASPYAAAKLAGEEMVLSYYHTYELPTVVMRPFNTYGPFQKSGGEGGVVAIFLTRDLRGQTLNIYGSGRQTRDFIYVKDCADFIYKVGNDNSMVGQVINAGSGTDVTVNKLAFMVCKDKKRIKHIKHIHPQSEIMKLKCDSRKARALLQWEPKFTLQQGLEETREWLRGRVLD